MITALVHRVSQGEGSSLHEGFRSMCRLDDLHVERECSNELQIQITLFSSSPGSLLGGSLGGSDASLTTRLVCEEVYQLDRKSVV